MLLQENVSVLLRPNVPSGWEEEMEAAGLVPKDESADLEDEDSKRDKFDDEDTSVEYVSTSSNKE